MRIGGDVHSREPLIHSPVLNGCRGLLAHGEGAINQADEIGKRAPYVYTNQRST
jgi:hypothetical protein